MPIGGFPVVAGHEGAGIILELGSGLENSELKVGDRVLLGFASCMNCRGCQEGSKGACDNIALTNFGGTRGLDDTSIRRPNGDFIRGPVFGQSSFSKLAICDARTAVKYPGPVEDLSFLAPLGCGFMTGAGTVLDVLKPKSNNSIAILGLGAVGLSALMAAKSLNVADIIAIDIIESRLELAKSLGATHALNGRKYKDVEAAIREASPRGTDFIVDTTGLTAMINSGIKALAQQGTLAIVGTPVPGEHLSVEGMDMLIHCKKIIGVTGAYANPQEVSLYSSSNKNVDIDHFSAYTASRETVPGWIIPHRRVVQDLHSNRDRPSNRRHEIRKGTICLHPSFEYCCSR